MPYKCIFKLYARQIRCLEGTITKSYITAVKIKLRKKIQSWMMLGASYTYIVE